MSPINGFNALYSKDTVGDRNPYTPYKQTTHIICNCGYSESSALTQNTYMGGERSLLPPKTGLINRRGKFLERVFSYLMFFYGP